ncbi:unnamed protein product [Staurois parvus]|uniref:SCP domain-containing protein n=1 Tax=Staurois parvus TaxID=386267 RepID=A0ABN9G9J0_9NEOB|nr:unnamed protein product [Staurois parvus]
MGRYRHLHPLLLCLPLLISALSNKEKKLIVDKHNVYRSQTDPPAANMRALSWDSTLEELATSYAAKCIWEHNEQRGLRGENLFLMSGSRMDVDMGLADWYNERDFYNFTADTCQEGQMCGHYTQVVWAETQRVGCGEQFCEKMEGFEHANMHFLVCNYEPPGNFQGQRAYKVGAPCSACPETHSCKESLCVDLDKEPKESSTDLPDTSSEPAPESVPELALYTIMMAPYTITISPDTVPMAPDTTSELGPDTTSQLIPEKQLESSSDKTVLEADITTAKSESDPTPPPVPTTTLSSTIPTTRSSTTTSDQILDLTPSGPEDSSIGYPQTPEDSSPQIALGTTDDDDRSILPATAIEHTSLDQGARHSNANTPPTEKQKDDRIPEESGRQSYTDSSLTTTRSSGDNTVSTKTDKILESISIVPPTPERPSISLGSPSPSKTISDQTFSKDGLNTGDVPTMATIGTASSSSKKVLDEDVSVLVDKDHPKDSPVQATPKPLQLLMPPSKDLNKGQKDQKNPYSDPRTAQKLKKEKEKSKQKANVSFFPKKDLLKPKFFSKGVKWGFKSGFSERSYFGNHVYSPGFGQAHRPLCPYPCLKPPSTFPLYNNNIASPGGDQHHKDWSSYKAITKKPCKLFGYKRGVYSLYLPSKNMEENLTKPKS